MTRPAAGQAVSISDDDLCASCRFLDYRPGELSLCTVGWPATFDADGYATECPKLSKIKREGLGPLITDPDVLDKLASVEGEAWRSYTSTTDSPYTFQGILAAFRKGLDETRGRRGVSATIYGDGGWNRWPVDPYTGEVWFSRHHARPLDIPRAEAAGFRVI